MQKLKKSESRKKKLPLRLQKMKKRRRKRRRQSGVQRTIFAGIMGAEGTIGGAGGAGARDGDGVIETIEGEVEVVIVDAVAIETTGMRTTIIKTKCME